MTGISLAQLAVAGGSVGGSLGIVLVMVKWTATFIAGRLDKREDRLDAGTQLLIGQLQEQVKGLLEHKETVERKLAECMERDIEKERRIAQLEGLAAGFGDARQHAALIVAGEKAKDKG